MIIGRTTVLKNYFVLAVLESAPSCLTGDRVNGDRTAARHVDDGAFACFPENYNVGDRNEDLHYGRYSSLWDP